jgi:ABC-type multidrug transport system fused ATPase/permease subunit
VRLLIASASSSTGPLPSKPAEERGEQLSVGERQLVASVRAQVADPGLLILDEATSAVHPSTERRITEALRRLSQAGPS